jgi:hypothetical protein
VGSTTQRGSIVGVRNWEHQSQKNPITIGQTALTTPSLRAGQNEGVREGVSGVKSGLEFERSEVRKVRNDGQFQKRRVVIPRQGE